MERLTCWPTPERGREAVLSVIAEWQREGRGATDLEFRETGIATIIGVASLTRCASWYWSEELGNAVIDAGVPLAAYAGIGADKPIFEQNLRRETPVSLWNDPMLKHWICNPDLASVPKAAFTDEGDTDSATVLGLMNIFSALSLLHDIPQWKHCIGQGECLRLGRPCRLHNELDYCSVDSYAGLVLDYSLDDEMERLKIPQSYYEWRKLIDSYCIAIKAKGIKVDQDVIDGLEAAIQSRKATLFPATTVTSPTVGPAKFCPVCSKEVKKGTCRTKTCPQYKLDTVPVAKVPKPYAKPRKVWSGPFNPNSPKAVIKWFGDHGIELMAGEAVPLDAEVETDISELPEPIDMLLRLAQKTVAGKGLSSWFDPKFIRNGEVHARFNSCGTATSRLSSSNPNFQNVPRVGFGAQVRNALVVRKGMKLLKADFSQLEFRVCLWAAGRDPNEADGAFDELTRRGGEQFLAAAVRNNWSPRDVAKSTVHGGDYLEGLILLNGKELNDPRRVTERKAHALAVYDGSDLPEWKFRGAYVCFTGANLAERLFGDRTRASRTKALAIQDIYLDAFPEIRRYQQEVSREVEFSGEVRLWSGHRVPLYGRVPEDDLKFAMACKGQGGGAIYAQESIQRLGDTGVIPNLHVHDENVIEVPQDMPDAECLEVLRPMVAPSGLMPGFTCPAKVKAGPSWGNMKDLGELRWQS